MSQRLRKFARSRTAKIVLLIVLMAIILWGNGDAFTRKAEAPVLQGIDIDGELDDWPEDMKRYFIPHRNRPESQFRVGYDPGENLLYVAVKVRDDALVVGNNAHSTDACEIYVHGGGTTEQLQLPIGMDVQLNGVQLHLAEALKPLQKMWTEVEIEQQVQKGVQWQLKLQEFYKNGALYQRDKIVALILQREAALRGQESVLRGQENVMRG